MQDKCLLFKDACDETPQVFDETKGKEFAANFHYYTRKECGSGYTRIIAA